MYKQHNSITLILVFLVSICWSHLETNNKRTTNLMTSCSKKWDIITSLYRSLNSFKPLYTTIYFAIEVMRTFRNFNSLDEDHFWTSFSAIHNTLLYNNHIPEKWQKIIKQNIFITICHVNIYINTIPIIFNVNIF